MKTYTVIRHIGRDKAVQPFTTTGLSSFDKARDHIAADFNAYYHEGNETSDTFTHILWHLDIKRLRDGVWQVTYGTVKHLWHTIKENDAVVEKEQPTMETLMRDSANQGGREWFATAIARLNSTIADMERYSARYDEATEGNPETGSALAPEDVLLLPMYIAFTQHK